MRLCPPGALVLLLLSCVTGPSPTADRTQAASSDAGVSATGSINFSVRIEEPRCAETPMEERARENCLCTWGRRCVCRGTMTVEVSRCVVAMGIDRVEGEPRIRLKDGGVAAPIGLLTHQQELFEAATLHRGQSTELCGTRLDCPP
jgi:hypothetical protein